VCVCVYLRVCGSEGTIDTSIDAVYYDVDLFNTPQSVIDELHAKGRAVICYVNVGASENWRADFKQFPAAAMGNGLAGWEGELPCVVPSGVLTFRSVVCLSLSVR